VVGDAFPIEVFPGEEPHLVAPHLADEGRGQTATGRPDGDIGTAPAAKSPSTHSFGEASTRATVVRTQSGSTGQSRAAERLPTIHHLCNCDLYFVRL
jgi:hypothetical protein